MKVLFSVKCQVDVASHGRFFHRRMIVEDGWMMVPQILGVWTLCCLTNSSGHPLDGRPRLVLIFRVGLCICTDQMSDVAF